jgi:hypothetical protein
MQHTEKGCRHIANYPGVGKASAAYQMTPETLAEHLAEHNPLDRPNRFGMLSKLTFRLTLVE